MGQPGKKVWILILTISISCMGWFPSSIGKAADVPFDQGIGYERGAYDPDAEQPTAFNWARQSGYQGNLLVEAKWSYETGNMLESSPTIGSDGTIYVGSNDGKLYALDPHAEDEADRVKWFFETGGWITSSPAIGADGTIYVGSYDGKLYALDPYASGDADRVKWFFETGDWIASSPAIGADGTIYVGSYDGKLYALDPYASGDADRLKWAYDLEDWIVSSPAIDSNGIIYVGSYEGKLYALNPNAASEADRVKWLYHLGLVIESSPAIGADGTIYVGSYDGKLYALDPYAAGDADRVKWFYETDGAIVSSPAIGLGGTIYIGSADDKLYALDPDAVSDTDRVKWFYQTGAGIRSSPILDADGTIYVGSYDGKLYALDPYAAGDADRLKGFYQIEREIRSSPAIGADGTIYVGSLDGKLYALGAISLAAPDKVIADAAEGAVHLTWNRVDGAARYQIYMHQGIAVPDVPEDWKSVHEETVTDTVYTVNNLTAGLPYWFTVKAVSAGGSESGYAEPVSATPYATIAKVEQFHPLQVPKGIEIAHLRLPGAVRVQLSNAAEVDLNVVWDVVQTEYDPEQAGTYTVTGLVQLPGYIHHPTALQVEIMIEVTSDTPVPGKIEIRGAGEITIPAGDSSATEQYEADVLNENGEMLPSERVRWNVSDADGVSIDPEQGLLTVTGRASTGQVTVKATLIRDTTIIGTMIVMLRADSGNASSGGGNGGSTVEDGDDREEDADPPGDQTPNKDEPEQDGGDGALTEDETGEADEGAPSDERGKAPPFSDAAGHWASVRIQRAVDLGIVAGYPDGTFRPDAAVSRAELTMMLYRLLGLSDAEAAAFTDDDQIGNWARQAISAAVNAGIVSGYEDGSFRPAYAVTRAEMAVMVARAMGLTWNAGAIPGFADDGDIPDWAKGAVAALREIGIVSGRGANRFAPNDTATRAEAVVVLLRMLEHSSS